MQQLHPHWRMEYIEAPRYPAAMKRPFSELPALGDDRAALIVHRSALSYLILNLFPYNPFPTRSSLSLSLFSGLVEF